MNSLDRYTDQELREELRRRILKKWESVRNERSERYIYVECTVTGRLKSRYGSRLNSFEMLMDKDYGYHRYGYNGYIVASGLGFCESNLPHIGDRVVMRRRKYKFKCDDDRSEWKICEIINE